MTLLSPLFLLFGLTALVPLILHLYQKRKRTALLYSTNRFFTQSIIRSQRRMRIRRILLLLLRMAACVFLALAVAQPVLNLLGLGAQAGNRDVVILLDDSLSMQAATGVGPAVPAGTSTGTRSERPAQPALPNAQPSHFARAKQIALETLGQLGGGDRAAVLTFTGRTLALAKKEGFDLSPDPLRVAAQLRDLECSSAAGDARAALARTAELFDSTRQRARVVLVISDLQATDWRQETWPQPKQPTDCILVHVGNPTTDNVAADELVLSQGTAVIGQPNLLRVRVVNYRPATTAAQLVLKVDDQEYVRRPVELVGQSPHAESIPITFDTPGEHRLAFTVDCQAGGDALPADNTLYGTVTVTRELPVLLVDGQAGGDAHRQSAGFFLRAAMLAVSPDGQSLRPDVVAPGELPGVKLDSYSVVVLSNVKELAPEQLERLEQFVQAGGGLAIFLGDQCDPAFYNEAMGAPTRPLGGLLPAEVKGIVGAERGSTPLHVHDAEMDHPVLQRFKGTLRAALAGLNVYRAYAVTPRETWVVAAMEDRLPLLVERSYGRGKVLLFTTAPTPAWTNLPLRRLFIPLVNRTMSYLAGGGAARGGHEIGRELVLQRGGWDTNQPLHVTRPDGVDIQASVRLLGAEPVAYLPEDAVTVPGFYRVQAATGPRAEGRGPRGGVVPAKAPAGSARPAETPGTLIAVNVPRSESAPEGLDLKEVDQVARLWRVRTIELGDERADTGRSAVAALLDAHRVSQGIWDLLLWAVLTLVLVEPLIANRLIGAKR